MATSVWFAGPRLVELRDEELPALGPHDVRVEAVASGISHGSEMLVFRGQVPDGVDLDLPTLRGSFAFPIKYGYANVGRVVAVGGAVNALEPGQMVFVHHPHQTTYVVPAASAVCLPDGLDPGSGVFLANVETAVNIVMDAAPRIGERVVVFGQGVVGLLITQVLLRTGAAEIAVVDPIARRRELALQFGADAAFDVDELTSGADFDLAIEASGSPSALDLALNNVAFGASVVVCSWYGTKSVTLALGGAFHRRRLRIVSSQVSTIDAALQPRWTRERRLAVARDLLPRLELNPLISHQIRFEQAAQAYRLVDEQPAETVQVLLTYR